MCIIKLSMGTNKKLIIVVFFLLLAFVTLNVFLISKYKTQLFKQTEIKQLEKTKKVPLPYINTSELPPAEVGVKYQAEIFASLSNANEDLTIKVVDLPEGLTSEKCSQEFDSKLIPTPNTLAKCIIEGIPTKDGLYLIKVNTTNKNINGYNTIEQTINLVITTS